MIIWDLEVSIEEKIRQFYLNSSEYGVFTFEPIHRLLEESTKLEMCERIDIKRCRK